MELITDPMNRLLHTKCEDLKYLNINSFTFLDNLVTLMNREKGVGLAAPQVGVLLNAFVMIRNDGSILKVVNPKVLERGKIIKSKGEGCLSLPGKRFTVKRAKRVKVQFENEYMDKIKMELRNREAFVFLHEFDHLNGILISD